MRRPVLAIAVAAAGLAAGCGGGSEEPRETRDSDGPALAPAPGGPDPQAFQKFQDCLRDNGFELPEAPPAGGPVEPPPEDVRRKCERHLPEGLPRPGEQPQRVPLP